MNIKIGRIILLSALLTIFFISCKEDSPTGPEAIPEGRITGTVIQQGTESPIQNVNIFTDPATSYVTTDENGQFIIINVDSGLYTITAHKTGYIDVTANVRLFTGDTALANFVLEEDPDVEPEPDPEPEPEPVEEVGSIFGKIIDADTYLPVAQVNITTAPVTGSIITGENGEYYITNLLQGLYKVIATKNSYDTTIVTVNVNLGDTTLVNLFLRKSDTTTVSTTGSISGHIFNSITDDPLKQVSIQTNPATSVVNSDTSGFYKISNVEAGLYNLTVYKTGYVSQTISVRVSAGVNTTADLNLTPTTGSISGIVTDNTGYPIYAVLVRTSPSTKVANTDRSGMFSLQNIEAGEYELVFTHAAFQQLTEVVVVRPGITTYVEIALSSP